MLIAQDQATDENKHSTHHHKTQETKLQHSEEFQQAVKEAHIHDHSGNLDESELHARQHAGSHYKAHIHDHQMDAFAAGAHATDHMPEE